MSLIAIRNVAKVYEGQGVTTTALHDISFDINTGEFVSIMGPSGSGKSTLLHILGLLDRPTHGQYILADRLTEGMSDEDLAHLRNSIIGFVFQAFFLLPRISVLENVIVPLYYSPVPRKEYETRALAALEQVAMTHRAYHTPMQLSGGERQRTAIARALVTNPQLILADEPTGNLDSKSGELVMEVIDQLHKQGRTVIVITHETPTAEYAERIIRIRDGGVESDQQVRAQHRHYQK